MIFCHILLGNIYFSNSFIFVSPSRCLWNYFTRFERDLNMMIQHPKVLFFFPILEGIIMSYHWKSFIQRYINDASLVNIKLSIP